ncbi:sodium/glucose cotransporter 4-like [Mercenaria mercenaria]|uniref:sodium/glucose cotransporter 4-like n=1 Tax=Mercenaria mercenaria TaxID=6596 RepID=UPI00234E494F|nr:sodium/glucose cotransporter 4-like [Mercenaria mercenaria]
METRRITHWGDIAVVVVYFVLVLLVGIWSLCRPNRGTVRSYFLAGRSMSWIPVGASLFSSNIGSEHFIGLAGTGAASGYSIVLYEWLAMPLLIVLAWIFVPVYVAAGVYTMPEYMTKRFGGQRIRIYLSVLAVILYIVTKLAVSIFAGALFIQLSMGWNMYLSVAVLLVVTGIFTILGGLAAVIYTDTFQTGIMLIGSIVLTVLSFKEIGGFANFYPMYMNATTAVRDTNSTCGLPREDAFHILRHPVTSDIPWLGTTLHILFGCLWYFCCDQVIVQRSLAAKTLPHAKAGSLVSGYLKILPMFIMIMPGMISRILYPDAVACVVPEECIKHCGNPVGCSNIAYPKLVLELLPTGLRGLLVAVMLSAIMSSLTSIFNSSSTLFTMDIWPRIRKRASERELLIVGRVFILLLCALSILWIPLVKSSKSGQLFIYIQAVQGYLGVPLGPLFIFAIFWHRMSEQAAFWSLAIGHLCGIIRMVLDFSMPAPGCDEPETRPAVLYKVHFTYFGILSFVITSLSIVIISYFTTSSNKIQGLTWWTRRNDIEENENDVLPENNVVSFEQGEAIETGEDQGPTKQLKFITLLYQVCGVPQKAVTVKNINMETESVYKEHFMKETSFWKNLLDMNAFIGVLVVVFLIGYYH